MIQPKDSRYPSIRANEDHVKRVETAAEKLEIPVSEFVRRTMDKELTRLAKRFPELAKQAA